VDAPKWLMAGIYLALGWVGVATMPQLLSRAGVGAVTLLAVGGALYSAGAIIYATRRPDPRPAVFGYHEIFHVLVIAAAAAHYAAIAGYALPAHA
jgi:hemolysin III